MNEGRNDDVALQGIIRITRDPVLLEILTDTFKIRGTLFVPLAAEGGYSSRLSDFLNNPDKHFLALTHVKVEALPDPEVKFEAPFLALNKSVVTMVRAIKE